MISDAKRTLPSGIRTLAQLFSWRVTQTPQAEAYRQFDPQSAAWISTNWSEAGALVAQWTHALAQMGMPRGSRIAILLPNGLDAVCIDQAALALACVPVPLHAIDNPESIAYILSDSEASMVIISSDKQWQAIASTGKVLPNLREVVVVRHDSGESAANEVPRVRSLKQWLSVTDSDFHMSKTLRSLPDENDLAALVYTSGTTGKPKGVMLTHRNVVSNVDATLDRVAPLTSDVFLSFLPLSHTFERTAGYYLPIAAGCCVAFARSVALLADDLKVVRPTILVSVPRIYERVHDKLQEVLAGSRLRARFFKVAETVGWRRFCRQQQLPVPGFNLKGLDELAWLILEPLVARRMLMQFGGRLRIAVSGGAPLAQPIARCFLGLGLPIVQGYGMTETSPIMAANAPGDNDPATVGRPLKGVTLRIGDNLELLVRSPGVMRGYWKRDEDTAAAFGDGWLRTGDQAAIENGRVRILGRVKEIIVTSTGEKISPADLELAITGDPLFEQAYVFGDNRPFITCVVVLNSAQWMRRATSLKLDPLLPSSLKHSEARTAILAHIRLLTRDFPHYAQPRAVHLTTTPWTPENTLLTPTLKIKRNNLAVHFAADIAALYRR